MRPCMDGVLDIINQTDKARFLAVAGRFLDVAAAFFLPTFTRNNFNVWLIPEILLSKPLAGFKQYAQFICKCFASALIWCSLYAVLRLFEEVIEGCTPKKMDTHFFRLRLAA